MSKVTDFTGKRKVLKLRNGREAIIGGLSLDIVIWIEENFVSLEEFQKSELDGEGKHRLTNKIKLIYETLENKEDFEGYRDFARCVDFNNIDDFMEVVADIFEESYGKQTSNNQSAGKKRKAGAK